MDFISKSSSHQHQREVCELHEIGIVDIRLLIVLLRLALHFKMQDLSCNNWSIMIKLQLITTN